MQKQSISHSYLSCKPREQQSWHYLIYIFVKNRELLSAWETRCHHLLHQCQVFLLATNFSQSPTWTSKTEYKEKKLTFCFCIRNLSTGISLKHLCYCFYCSQRAFFDMRLCKLLEIHLKPFKPAGGIPWHLPASYFPFKQLYIRVNNPFSVPTGLMTYFLWCAQTKGIQLWSSTIMHYTYNNYNKMISKKA